MRAWAPAVLVLLGAMGACATGCSAIAARDPGPIPCEMDGTDNPCPDGTHCVGNVCTQTACTPIPEICNGQDDDCNGIVDDGMMLCTNGVCLHGECRTDCSVGEVCNGRDDNCNGQIDEGLDVDDDADGYVACNVAMPALDDCNDRDPNVHPGATERCNGFDDDCDPRTAETGQVDCAAGMICSVATGETVPRCINPRDCRLVPCLATELCDASSTCCTRGAPGCGAPTDCRSPTNPCPTGFRCAGSGTSSMTYSCVPLGALGDTCTADRECASSHCYTRQSLRLSGTGSICGVACCTDADCTTGTCWAPGTGARSCVLPAELTGITHNYHLCQTPHGCGSDACIAASVPGSGTTMEAAWICGSAGTSSCGFSGTCDSRLCRAMTFCIEPCGNDHDCPFLTPACAYTPVNAGGHTDWLTGCFYNDGARQGETCSVDSDCLDGLCLAGTCADTCCNDSRCAAGSTCSPIDHSGWEMRCVPSATVSPG